MIQERSGLCLTWESPGVDWSQGREEEVAGSGDGPATRNDQKWRKPVDKRIPSTKGSASAKKRPS